MGTSIFGNVKNGAVAVPVTLTGTVEYGQILKIDGANGYTKATASTDKIAGVAAGDGVSGDEIAMVVSGPCDVQVAAINFSSATSNLCTVNSDGRAVVAGTAGQFLAVRLLPMVGSFKGQTNYSAGDLCEAVIIGGCFAAV